MHKTHELQEPQEQNKINVQNGVSTYDDVYQAMWLVDNLTTRQKQRLELVYNLAQPLRAPFLQSICAGIFDESLTKLNNAIKTGKCNSYKFCSSNSRTHRNIVVERMVNTLILRYDTLEI